MLHQYVCSRYHETLKMCILLVEITLKENLISWHKVSMNLVILVHPTRLRILFIGRFSIVTQERLISKFHLHCSKPRDVSRFEILGFSCYYAKCLWYWTFNLDNDKSIELPMSIYVLFRSTWSPWTEFEFFHQDPSLRNLFSKCQDSSCFST